MEAITYSLRGEQADSDCYYMDVQCFSAELLREAQERTGTLIADFLAFQARAGKEKPRGLPEYALELLNLGVLWQIYAGKDDSMDGLDRLVSWLGGSSRFERLARRLAPWRDYLAGLPDRERVSALEGVFSLAVWFDSNSREALGAYTAHVERFLAEIYPTYRGRDDEVLCGRRRVEYHLNMVGTEVLSRAFREAFLAAKRKIVVVPACMKARPDDECLADATPFGARCAGCTPGCHVQAVTRLGEENGFEVYMLPEDLGVFRGGAGRLAQAGSIGIVGVSCVLTNVDGGWQMRDLGVPAQGLLLDYCGCSYHWHPEGIATDLNHRQLLKLLGLN